MPPIQRRRLPADDRLVDHRRPGVGAGRRLLHPQQDFGIFLLAGREVLQVHDAALEHQLDAQLVAAQLAGAHLRRAVLHGDVQRVLIDIVITLILASAAWGIFKTAINRQLPYETLDALAMADGEVLGTGLSRLETLLPLLRKFLFIAMIVVVAMIVISSLGINIGPLLAGAGVVGIAVGFGAQTLVRDILSGIFFSSTTPSASANTSMSARVRGPSSACRSGR